jgi:rhomboid protease GluP
MSELRVAVADGLDRWQANDAVVLLAALGIAGDGVVEADGRWSVVVDEVDAERARAILDDEDLAAPAPGPAAERAATHGGVPRALWLGRDGWAVAVVLAACVAWFVRMNFAGEELTRARLLHFGAISWGQVWLGEWWRLASGVFVHFDGVHLLTNMLTLLLVGPPLAALLGPWRFLLIFILTGIAGNLVSHLIAASESLKAGASGGIAGVLGALAGTSLDPGWGGRFKRWQVLGALAAIYALLVGAGPDRDNAAHLGGLLAGVALGRWLTPRDPGRRSSSGDVAG